MEGRWGSAVVAFSSRGGRRGLQDVADLRPGGEHPLDPAAQLVVSGRLGVSWATARPLLTVAGRGCSVVVRRPFAALSARVGLIDARKTAPGPSLMKLFKLLS
jgi:hypothetical protein